MSCPILPGFALMLIHPNLDIAHHDSTRMILPKNEDEILKTRMNLSKNEDDLFAETRMIFICST